MSFVRYEKLTPCTFILTTPVLERTNFDEEFGTSNGDYTLGEMFWTATNLFGGRYERNNLVRTSLRNEEPNTAEKLFIKDDAICYFTVE
jgi:hypothetical protein